MRKAINGTLKILTISSVIVSMLLILVAFCTQYSIKEKSDLKSRTNILAQCLDGYDEDIEINIPRNYDLILKSYYGDYMKLPDENQRYSHHHFTPYWNDKYLHKI